MLNMLKLKSNLKFTFLLMLVVGAEVWAAKVAWHTLGEVDSQFLLMLVWFNLAPLLLGWLNFRRIGICVTLLGAMLSIPGQIFLCYRWHKLSEETLSIASYVEGFKSRTGSYPKNLSAYNRLYPSLKQEVVYKYYKPNDYAVHFSIGSVGTEHWYESGSGWWYYPD